MNDYGRMWIALEKAIFAVLMLLLFVAVLVGGVVLVFKGAYWLADLEF